MGNFEVEYPGGIIFPRLCCWREEGWDSEADCLGIERRGGWRMDQGGGRGRGDRWGGVGKPFLRPLGGLQKLLPLSIHGPLSYPPTPSLPHQPSEVSDGLRGRWRPPRSAAASEVGGGLRGRRRPPRSAVASEVASGRGSQGSCLLGCQSTNSTELNF